MSKSVKFRAKCLIKTTVPLYQFSRSLICMCQISHSPWNPEKVVSSRAAQQLKSNCHFLCYFFLFNFHLSPIANSILRAVDLGNPGSYLPCFDRFISQAVLPLPAV